MIFKFGDYGPHSFYRVPFRQEQRQAAGIT
jgi:hypothetical protein